MVTIDFNNGTFDAVGFLYPSGYQFFPVPFLPFIKTPASVGAMRSTVCLIISRALFRRSSPEPWICMHLFATPSFFSVMRGFIHGIPDGNQQTIEIRGVLDKIKGLFNASTAVSMLAWPDIITMGTSDRGFEFSWLPYHPFWHLMSRMITS